MTHEILEDFRSEARKAVEALKRDLSKLRTGRANVAILDGIKVPYYGVPTPLNQVATLAVPDPRQITVSPWEKKIIGDIEKAILSSGLGLNPTNDGKLVRIAIPALTTERRRELNRQVRKTVEEYKVTIRNSRRDSNELFKGEKDDKNISEDEYHRELKRVQDETDVFIKKVDEVGAAKEEEISEG